MSLCKLQREIRKDKSVYKEGRRDGKMNRCNLAFHKRLVNIQILYQNSRTTKQEVYNPKYTPKTVKLKI
jgi:hypothetical protein